MMLELYCIAGDSLPYHNNRQLTEKKRNNYQGSSVNCAVEFSGAWWYKCCCCSNLNEKYFRDGQINKESEVWF